MSISRITRKIEENSFVFEIIVSELVALNCLYKEENTCHRQSMCQQTVLRFCIELRYTFSDWIMLRVINKYDKGTVVQIATVFVPVDHLVCGRVFWSVIFQTFISSPFSETVISEIHLLWGSSFFSKCSKENAYFKKEDKNWEKVFYFWDKCIWICCFKLRLLRREYLSSAVTLLTSSLKILHSTNLDFFGLNYLQIDQ